MNTGLAGKVVVITGGAGGIGRACALAFAAEGAKVVVADLNLPQAETVAAEVGAKDRALALQVDVTNTDSVRALFEAVTKTFGRVDVLVNNAGIFHRTPIDDMTAQEWDQLLAVNLKGVFLCAQGALRIMKQQRAGKIVNMASMGGQLGGIIAGADYSASKAGVACFTKSLAKNAGPFGINVNSVNPGVIDTEMTRPWGQETLDRQRENTPLRRLGTAEEVANAVVFLATDAASFIHGTHLDVNGGLYMD
ncbi:MAG: SDR family NAD(P)-dependent oxidoreductase [Dehalococcoidales bacterium]|nr:SDR family NAD(P)-dependent oxidoreductase [Dehalococcoidales bacterium]